MIAHAHLCLIFVLVNVFHIFLIEGKFRATFRRYGPIDLVMSSSPIPHDLSNIATQKHLKPRNKLETACINILTQVVSKKIPDSSRGKAFTIINSSDDENSYATFTSIAKLLLTEGRSEDIRNRVVDILRETIHPIILKAFRLLSNYNRRFICEMSAVFMSLGFFNWLVGPTSRFRVSLEEMNTYNSISPAPAHAVPSTALVADNILASISDINSSNSWYSGVKIDKCLFLEESGCKSACIHLCKAPTQEFFSKDLGMPLYMKPNFQDKSCEMFFGMTPPPQEVDTDFQENCYSTCSLLSKLEIKKTKKIEDDNRLHLLP